MKTDFQRGVSTHNIRMQIQVFFFLVLNRRACELFYYTVLSVQWKYRIRVVMSLIKTLSYQLVWIQQIRVDNFLIFCLFKNYTKWFHWLSTFYSIILIYLKIFWTNDLFFVHHYRKCMYRLFFKYFTLS